MNKLILALSLSVFALLFVNCATNYNSFSTVMYDTTVAVEGEDNIKAFIGTTLNEALVNAKKERYTKVVSIESGSIMNTSGIIDNTLVRIRCRK